VFPLLLAAFVVVPLVELAVNLQVGDVLGVPTTILLLLLDSILGAVLVKREGRRAWDAFRRALSAGRWPGDEVAQGALVLVGGALLLTPGFVTDVVGLLAVLPPTRAVASRGLRRWATPAPLREVTDVLGGRGRRPRRDRPGPRGRPGPGEADDRGRPGRGAHRAGDGRNLDVEVVSVERDRPEPQRPRRSGEEPDGPS
jgi:UPF0716 protein FxsA